MYDFLIRNPWVVIPVVGCLIPIIAITLTFWRQIQRDAVNGELKRMMIDRGMSADDIVRVLEAGDEDAAKIKAIQPIIQNQKF